MDCYFISRIPLLICPISSDSVELTMKRVVIFAIFPRRLLVTVLTSCIGLCQLHSPLKVWSSWPPPSSAIKVPRYWCLTLSWYSQWNNAVGVFSYNEVLLNCWNVRKLLISFNCVGSLLELALWLSLSWSVVRLSGTYLLSPMPNPAHTLPKACLWERVCSTYKQCF